MSNLVRLSFFRVTLAVLLAAIMAAGTIALAGSARATETPSPTDVPADTYRVNAGGSEFTAPDGTVYSEDSDQNPSPYLVNPENTAATNFSSLCSSITKASSAGDAPVEIFQDERYASDSNNLEYAFPVPNGNYTVRLYFAETYVSDQDQPEDREFDIAVEVEDEVANFDISDEASKETNGGSGACVGVGKEFTPVEVTDDTLNVVLQDTAKENPTIRGIEILPAGPTDPGEPQISALKPKPGSKTRDRTPTISANVTDVGSELEKEHIKLFVDGQEKDFSYDQQTDLLSYQSGRLSRGGHTVSVEATDQAGNKAVEPWSFRVVKRR